MKKKGVVMSKKDGMYLYSDWLAPFEKLEAEEVGALVIAMMRYFTYGEEPPAFEGLCAMAADFIFPQIDRSMEYAKLGSKGGAAKKGKRYPKEKENLHEEKELNSDEDVSEYTFQPNEPKYQNEEREQGNFGGNYEPRYSEQGCGDNLLVRRFEDFWYEYPRKAEKQRAWGVFKKLSPDTDLFLKIMDGVKRQKKSKRWTKESGQYIPFPANWLDGERWNDIVEEESAGSFDTDDFFDLAVKRAQEYCCTPD